MLPDLNDLYFFYLVVEQRSFTKAGRSIGITKSKISRRISELESRLGVRLLHRSTRKLALTDIGQIFYQHCKAMVDEAQSAQEAIELVQSKPRGRIRVTCPALFAQSTFTDIITRFMQQYQEVTIVLNATDRPVDLFQEGFDVAIRFQANTFEDSTLVVRKLGLSFSSLIASPTYLNHHGTPQTPQDLVNHACFAKTRNEGMSQFLLTHNDGRQISVHFQPILESNEWLVLKQAALSHLGITMMPQEICRKEIDSGLLVPILTEWSLPKASLYIIYPSRRGLIPAIRSFIDFVAEELINNCTNIRLK
ncbi:LysR substrate-binding domain-containing protein [Legionella pneumophila]|uniref:Transcriptional regulator, LysR family n=1 Tax=Legionella pneumophila subsp. pneumophila (strain Philadelphia 1 / ATCC 33152 / DSM 7513) TaxID=272624 RepID=Q5ZT74_LEGPH|nr:LysR substrate-binding domain-containing protein [Legionella pneumophila]AAU28353.1 transcriptional regulator, LysR family [Legionella pneumophila subsp. pneumophila str. Philadelphia 1]AOU14136.1 LysR family transcriptional regulator [Legionella pneumophila]APT99321.1 LysR family transcriptional regulator [Legionella pneumophila]UAK61505.1 LysR family transcriptional regulator [Legionella pneumophila]STY08814.1 LysR family transcriptional regulator [Legionella pneumophila]